MKTFLPRALAVLLIVVAHGFLLNVPQARTVVLGGAYLVSVLVLGFAAWQLWTGTIE